jgi:hypothetical protein
VADFSYKKHIAVLDPLSRVFPDNIKITCQHIYASMRHHRGMDEVKSAVKSEMPKDVHYSVRCTVVAENGQQCPNTAYILMGRRNFCSDHLGSKDDTQVRHKNIMVL